MKYLAILVFLTTTTLVAQENSELDGLFVSGEDGYACYRIPTVVKANDGSVLAICEARKKGCSDTGDIDLVMKKSLDNGLTWGEMKVIWNDGENVLTWGEMKVIWNDGENVCGNPAPVVDKQTGDIHLLSTWNNGKDHESRIIAGTSIDGREIYHLVSSDAGDSWSSPRNITSSVKLPDWTWYATGPVHGIQVTGKANKGRLVIPCDHIEKNSKKYYSHAIYSDDHGKSWKLGGTTPNDQVNECTVAELNNGDLILNMRNYARKDSQVRQVAISKDGGDTWVDQRFDSQLPEPRCQGALLAIGKKKKHRLLFTNPADPKARKNMTLSVSWDGGVTWLKKINIFKSHAAYSDLVELDNGDIFVFYEAGEQGAYETISYKIIPKDQVQ